MNPIFASLPTTIFDEMSALAREHGAINLGQGFPAGDGPEDIRRAAAEALLGEGYNQYPPMPGLPVLRQAVVDHYARVHGLGASVDEVLVTSGATEALAASLLALIAPGDEVILIQPMYDSYLPMVRAAGGVPRFISLCPPEWRLTAEALEAAITPRTRLIMLNNPMNPACRAFDRIELGVIAEICVRHDLIAISDEVWEHVVFDGRAHVPLITLPGMRERTVKIGSAGKIFSMTGWKVGFVVAVPRLHQLVMRAHQFLTFTTPAALQAAVAFGLGKDDAWFAAMRANYQRSRDRFASALTAAGYRVLPSEATYFFNIDLPASGVTEDDTTFCRRIVTTAGVAAIPVSAFYAENAVRSVARFCFAKSDAMLDEAAERLAQARTA